MHFAEPLSTLSCYMPRHSSGRKPLIPLWKGGKSVTLASVCALVLLGTYVDVIRSRLNTYLLTSRSQHMLVFAVFPQINPDKADVRLCLTRRITPPAHAHTRREVAGCIQAASIVCLRASLPTSVLRTSGSWITHICVALVCGVHICLSHSNYVTLPRSYIQHMHV